MKRDYKIPPDIQNAMDEIRKITGVGDRTAEVVLAYTGSVENIAKAKMEYLLKIPCVGKKTAEKIVTAFKNLKNEK